MAAYRPFRCSICLNDYRDPKILSCFHSFCLECLKDCFESSHADAIKCPLCRKVTPMPKEGVKGLSNNIYVEPNLGTSSPGKLYCGFCCSNFVAEFHCRDCSDYLCLKCKEQHVQIKQTKDHQLEIVQEDKAIKSNETEKCPHHIAKEVVFGCYQCNVACCSECWEADHTNHKIGPLTEVATSMRGAIGECIEGSKNQLVMMVEEKGKIMVDKDRMDTLIAHTMTDIDIKMGLLKQRLDNLSIGIKNELRETGDVLNMQLQKDLEKVENRSKLVSELIKSTTERMAKANNINIIKIGTDVKTLLTDKNSEMDFIKRYATQVATSDIERAILTSLRDHRDTPAFNILHPTLESHVVHSIKVKSKNITATKCLSNGCVLLCDNNKSRLHQLTVDGDRFGSFRAPFRVADFAQLGDSSLLITKYKGKKIAKFWMDGNYVDTVRMNGFTLGLAPTHNADRVIVCCSDVKKDKQTGTTNSRLVIVGAALDVQRQVKIQSGREVVRRACQNRNADFVAITSRRCFVLSESGDLKFIYKFYGIVHSVCANSNGNIIILHEENGTKIVSLYDANMMWVRNLFRFAKTYGENKTATLESGRDGCLWTSIYERVRCIKYTL